MTIPDESNISPLTRNGHPSSLIFDLTLLVTVWGRIPPIISAQGASSRLQLRHLAVVDVADVEDDGCGPIAERICAHRSIHCASYFVYKTSTLARSERREFSPAVFCGTDSDGRRPTSANFRALPSFWRGWHLQRYLRSDGRAKFRTRPPVPLHRVFLSSESSGKPHASRTYVSLLISPEPMLARPSSSPNSDLIFNRNKTE